MHLYDYMAAHWLELFTFITGLIFIYLEIRQKNVMWVVGLLQSGAAIAAFWGKGLYASMTLNIYYVVVAFLGLYTWVKDSARVRSKEVAPEGRLAGGEAHEAKRDDRIHLRKLNSSVILISALVLIAGTVVLVYIMTTAASAASDLQLSNYVELDAFVTVLSAIATFWLTRSYIEQWLLWIVADLLTSILCICSGMYWLSVLYAVYSISAVYGYIHWRRKGVYLQ